jgi:hypothetical protein
MAYDAQRGRVVLFGGQLQAYPSPLQSDTWEWDGTSWLQRVSSHAPAARLGTAIAYDGQAQRTFLFGGFDGQVVRSDAWEWDGTDWTLHTSSHAPSPRSNHAMAYDSVRQRVVLFGGQTLFLNISFPLNDTWEWDGVDWLAQTPTNVPAARPGQTMAFDAPNGRTILVQPGTSSPSPSVDETWAWDGVDWSRLQAADLPPPSIGPRRYLLALDAVRGDGALVVSDRSWTWSGTQWRPTTPILTNPVLLYDPRLARTVMFAPDLTETWSWQGSRWTLLTPTSPPPPRRRFGLAYDSARRCTVLFGGTDYQTYWNDTWEWDGQVWTQRTPAHAPTARFGHAMAYDSRRAHTLLFGGYSGFERSDIWQWDGVDWTQRLCNTAPQPGSSYSMAYDSQRDRMVLFAAPILNALRQTWEWDDVDWHSMAAAHMPTTVEEPLAYDSRRQRCVMVGTAPGGTTYVTLEWDGNDWASFAPPAGTTTLNYPIAYDVQRGRTVLFLGPPTYTTHEYGVPGAAVAAAIGAGCGTPALTATPSAGSQPILGQTQSIDIANVPAGIVFIDYGWSNVAAGVFALPMRLDLLGMPGCELLTSIDQLAEPCLATGPSTAQHTVAIPALPWLLGVHIWLQPWAPAPGQNAAGLVAGNAVSLLLGI